jgi:hypothetical protein
LGRRAPFSAVPERLAKKTGAVSAAPGNLPKEEDESAKPLAATRSRSTAMQEQCLKYLLLKSDI